MSKELLKCNDYALMTFSSTSQALKAEKLFQTRKADYLTVPTLREISGSCGLSIKIAPANLTDYYNFLSSNKVSISGTYRVIKEGRINRVEPIIVLSPADKTKHHQL